VTIGAAVMFVAGTAVAAQPSGSLEVSTPAASTQKWQNARELLTILDAAEDRVALAISVRDQCIAGANLSPEQIVDGLHITGHVLYRDREYDAARVAFEALHARQTSNHYFVDACRMLAQIARQDRNYAQSLTYYDLALPVAQAEYDAGVSSSVMLIKAGMVDVYRLLDDPQAAAPLADDLVAMSDAGVALLPRNTLLLQAAECHRDAGDGPRAAELYEILLADEDFGFSPTDWGFRPVVVMDKMKCEGHDLDACDPEAMQAATAIVADATYAAMPATYALADRVASCLLQKGQDDAAMQLWVVCVKQIDDQIPTLALDKEWTKPALRRAQASMMWNAFTLIEERNLTMPSYAANFLDRLETEFIDVAPQLAQRAADFRLQLLP